MLPIVLSFAAGLGAMGAVAIVAITVRQRARAVLGAAPTVRMPAASAVRILKDDGELREALERASATERHLAGVAAERYSRHQSRPVQQRLA